MTSTGIIKSYSIVHQLRTPHNYTSITIYGFGMYLETGAWSFCYGFPTPNSKHFATELNVRKLRFGVGNQVSAHHSVFWNQI
jgi:hypothetical protein